MKKIKIGHIFCNRIQKLDTKLLEFRNLIRETVYDACRSNGNLRDTRNRFLQ